MFYYLELHNHTDESDGNLSVKKLFEFMKHNRADAFVLTDHNTTSGHRKMDALVRQHSRRPDCIHGLEYTTWHGHVLTFFSETYHSWADLNPFQPDPFFRKLRSDGTLVGVAHPFSAGFPESNGCRFTMEIQDFHSIDFIEVINNSESMHTVNNQGISWWQSLVLDGYPIAATSGMDLHGSVSLDDSFGTFIFSEAKKASGEDLQKLFKSSILQQQTYISRGPILSVDFDKNSETIYPRLHASPKPGAQNLSQPYLLTFTSKEQVYTFPFETGRKLAIPAKDLGGAPVLIAKLYQRDTSIQNLVAIAPPIFLSH